VKVLAYPFILVVSLLVIRYNYSVLLFHTFAELFSIFVGLLMLVVVLNTYHFVRNDFLIYLGIGYFSISVLDTLHTFTLSGMPFFNITNSEITIHLWIYSRLFEALLLLSAPIFLSKHLKTKLMIVITAVLVSLLIIAAFQLKQPVMFVDGKLSNFKVYTEFVIIFLLACAIILYWHKRAVIEKNVLFWMISSLGLTIVAELCFTLYTSFNGAAFVIGHIFKFLSFWMIYQAIIQTTLNEPLKLLTISSNSYDVIPNPAIRVDEFCVISQVNHAAVSIAKINAEQLVHQSIHTFFHPDSAPKSECQFCHSIKKGQIISDMEVYFPQYNKWFLLSLSPVDSLNIKGGIVQSLTNITHQKAQERELLEHQELLEIRVKERTQELEASFERLSNTQNQLLESKKMASLGDMVAGVAHEINTPIGICITAASSLSELTVSLKNDFANNQVSRTGFSQYITAAENNTILIESSLQRAAELVGSFKQVAVDQASEKLRKFPVKQYITEVLFNLSPAFKKWDIDINFNSDDDFKVKTSPSAISQILTNFMMNSLAHAFDDGEHGEVTIEVCKDNDWVTLIYQDSGKGISAESLEKIYEPFYTTKRGQGGSGLGLHITYNLVHQSLGGTILCKSEEGQGVTFIVKFPVEKVIKS
jgi:signal transduction histidine kinase